MHLANRGFEVVAADFLDADAPCGRAEGRVCAVARIAFGFRNANGACSALELCGETFDAVFSELQSHQLRAAGRRPRCMISRRCSSLARAARLGRDGPARSVGVRLVSRGNDWRKAFRRVRKGGSTWRSTHISYQRRPRSLVRLVPTSHPSGGALSRWCCRRLTRQGWLERSLAARCPRSRISNAHCNAASRWPHSPITTSSKRGACP